MKLTEDDNESVGEREQVKGDQSAGGPSEVRALNKRRKGRRGSLPLNN